MGAVGYPVLFLVFIAVVALTHLEPNILGDANPFMKQFVDEQMLNILGVIIAIFLPSAAALYIRLAELEAERKRDLSGYRRGIKINCTVLMGLFMTTILLLIAKGAAGDEEQFTSAVNGLSLVVLLANLLVLIDLTLAMFQVGEASSRRRGATSTSGSKDDPQSEPHRGQQFEESPDR